METIKLQPGDFISIPAWDAYGQVIATDLPHYGSDDAQRVLLQEHPEQPASACRWYHLEPGTFELD